MTKLKNVNPGEVLMGILQRCICGMMSIYKEHLLQGASAARSASPTLMLTVWPIRLGYQYPSNFCIQFKRRFGGDSGRVEVAV